MSEAMGSPHDDVMVSLAAGVATITLNRPASRNAIALATMDQLASALDHVVELAAAVVVLRGAGERAFISGGDIKDLSALQTHDAATEMAVRMRGVLYRLVELPMPTVAALNGHALGGGAEVAIACDLRVAADDVLVGFPQSRLGIMPAWGGAERLVELVGRSVALDLMLTGRRVNAANALSLGLVNDVVPRGSFDAGVTDYAAELAELPRTVAGSIKSLVRAVRPNLHPDSRDAAVDAFARLWIADEHWTAVSGPNGT